MEDLIDRVRLIVRFHRINQGEMAQEIGIHESTLSRILNGRQSPLPIVRKQLQEWFEQHKGEYPISVEEP